MEDIIKITINNQANGTRKSEYESQINAKAGAIKNALNFLDVEGDIYKEGSLYYKTAMSLFVEEE